MRSFDDPSVARGVAVDLLHVDAAGLVVGADHLASTDVGGYVVGRDAPEDKVADFELVAVDWGADFLLFGSGAGKVDADTSVQCRGQA